VVGFDIGCHEAIYLFNDKLLRSWKVFKTQW